MVRVWQAGPTPKPDDTAEEAEEKAAQGKFVEMAPDDWLSAVQQRWSNPNHGLNKEYREGFLNAIELVRASMPDDPRMLEAIKTLTETPVKQPEAVQAAPTVDVALEKRAKGLEKLLRGAIGALRAAGKDQTADKIEKAIEKAG